MNDSFSCSGEGYVRHWLVCGPHRTPYGGPGGSDEAMRQAAVDARIASPPAEAALGAHGPNGEPWRFYAPGHNIFVECSGFSSLLEVLELWAVTDVHAAAAGALPARLWACGTADLYVNGIHALRQSVPRYMYPEAAAFSLPLRQGANRLAVRLQALGVRDTRMLFGLEVLEGGTELAVRLPGDPAATAGLSRAEAWLMSVRAACRAELAARGPAPEGACVLKGTSPIPWPADSSSLKFDPDGAFSLRVVVPAAGETLERLLELPANRPPAMSSRLPVAEHRREHLRHLAGVGGRHILNVLARRALGEAGDDAGIIAETLEGIDERRDCSDFTLAALLRMVFLGLASPGEEAAIRRSALAFRYWDDEPGTDAMCFRSENHSLLFHGCQVLAGRLWPADRFSNCGLTGAEQAAAGLRRCAAWLAEAEATGFREYLSSSYMPLTAAALINIVDFAGDAALAQRAAGLADGVFRDLATHAFDGVVAAPQGRVYRNVLYPEAGGTQALLSYAVPEAVVARSNWLAAIATSPTYQPPEGLAELMRRPACRRYRQDGVEVVLHKTEDYLLTSLAIPASFDSGEGSAEAPANWRAALWPGKAGYQQHLWQATLARDCHVFANHPGATFDQSQSRPGYWYGNGVLPRLSQAAGLLTEAFEIPEAHPVGFTHAHWPSDAFERQELRGQWAFGQRRSGAVALWCSRPLVPHDDVLTGRELRAYGRRVAWLCRCGPARGAGAFESFVRACLEAGPPVAAGRESPR